MQNDIAEEQAGAALVVKLRYTAQVPILQGIKNLEEIWLTSPYHTVVSERGLFGSPDRKARQFALSLIDGEEYLDHIVAQHGLKGETILSAELDGEKLFGGDIEPEPDTFVYEAEIPLPDELVRRLEACYADSAIDPRVGVITTGSSETGYGYAFRNIKKLWGIKISEGWHIKGSGVTRQAVLPADAEIGDIFHALVQDVALHSIGREKFCRLIKRSALSADDITTVDVSGVGRIYDRPDTGEQEAVMDEPQACYIRLWNGPSADDAEVS